MHTASGPSNARKTEERIISGMTNALQEADGGYLTEAS